MLGPWCALQMPSLQTKVIKAMALPQHCGNTVQGFIHARQAFNTKTTSSFTKPLWKVVFVEGTNIAIYLKVSNCISLYFENICLGSHLPVTIIVYKGQKFFNLSQRMVNILLILKYDFGATEMAQQVGALTSLPKVLRSIPSNHMVAHNHPLMCWRHQQYNHIHEINE